MEAVSPSRRMISPTSFWCPTRTSSYIAAPDIPSAITTARTRQRQRVCKGSFEGFQAYVHNPFAKARKENSPPREPKRGHSPPLQHNGDKTCTHYACTMGAYCMSFRFAWPMSAPQLNFHLERDKKNVPLPTPTKAQRETKLSNSGLQDIYKLSN